MADALFRFVVSLPSTTGIPADKVENVLSCGLDGVLGVNDLEDAADAIEFFYNGTAPGQNTPMSTYLSESLSRAANACSVAVYTTLDLTGGTFFGSPVLTQTFTLGAIGAGSPLPEEIATVISYHANLNNVPAEVGNTRPAQRRRGRMYLGPFNDQAGADVGSLYRPSLGFRTNVAVAFPFMADTINNIPNLYFGIWSKLDAEVWAADAGWIDDAWDVQRRRGVAASSRSSFNII